MRLGDIISVAEAEKCGRRTFPVLSMTMHDGLVLQTDRFRKSIASKDLSGYKVVRRNQLVVSFPIDEGVLYIQDVTDAGIVSPAYAVWDINAKMVCPSFLGMFLRCPKSIQFYRAKLRGSTARRRTIPREDFLAMGIPEFSIAEQNRLCLVIEKIESVIKACDKQIQSLDQLVKSQFVEMFGDLKINPCHWHRRPFSHFASVDTRMVKDINRYADYPHIGIDSIERGTGTLSGFRTVKEDNVISGKYLFSSKHIIYSKIRPSLNKVALPNFDGVCSADAYPILPVDSVSDRVFVAYLLRSSFFLDYILPLSGRANMPKVNKEQLQGFCTPLPPLALQREFAAFVAKVDKLAFAVRQRRDTARKLYRAKIQEFFG